MTIEFMPTTPQKVREQITQALTWVDASEVRLLMLAARMETIYYAGKMDGLSEAQDSAIKVIRNFGKAAQS